MAESKMTSDIIYEDDFSFVTEDGELYLKSSSHVDERKLCKVEPDGYEQKVDELKSAFEEVRQKVYGLVEQEHPELPDIRQMKEELLTAKAIGNFEELYDKLASLEQKAIEDSAEEESESTDKHSEESSPPSDEDIKGTDEADEVSADTEEEIESEETTEADEEKAGAEDEEADENPMHFYQSIVDRAEELSKQDDWPYVTMELDKLTREWGEGPETDSDKVKELFQKFTDTVEAFEERKKEHYEKLNKQRKENLKKKKELLSTLRSIVEEKEWTATGKVGSIKGKWNSIGQVPSGEGEGLDEEFEQLLSTFNEHKVDRLVQKRQKEEDNLTLKLIVLDKMEKVAGSIDASTSDWEEIDERFNDLTTQWKKIGRVPREKSNEVWQRYKNVQDLYYDKKYEFHKEHRSKVDSFRSKKENLINEAEALLEEDDLASAARKINKLHRRWKKVGNLPQRLEDKLWDQFKAATDAFNERKSKNADKIQELEEQHYQEKLKLIEEAEAIKDTTEWDKGHQKMQSLMDKWKAVGPVSRKKSNKIWKQFKGAMDVFYDRRREHFKEVKEKRKDNLEEKEEILEKLWELSRHDDPIEAVEKAKELQSRFKDAGYVPIKKKNEIWKEYRKACDVIYDRYRAAKSGDKFDQELAKADLGRKERSKIQDMRKQYNRIKKEVRDIEDEVLNYKEKKTYFKPTKKKNPLLEEIQQKIDTAEEKLQEKQDKLESLTQEMQNIKEEA